jgi:hypothetical protein
MGDKVIAALLLVLPALVSACRSPCEKLVHAICEFDEETCEQAKDLTGRGATPSPERDRNCRVQLEELDRFPRPHTREQLRESGARAGWRTREHPAARVAGLPTGYAPTADWIWQDAFSAVLQGAGEPLLPEIPGDSYRFVWGPSMKGTAFVVRATKNDAGAWVEWKHLDVDGEAAYYSPTRVAVSSKRVVSPDEWHELTQRILLARALPARSDQLGSDGSEWLLETVVDGGYAMSLRWSPEQRDEPVFRDACRALVSLGTPDGGYDGLRP